MKLSKRLELVASFVQEGSRVADVGTDHGYVPIALVERRTAIKAIAMDLREGPLMRAKTHIREAGLEDCIETRLSDGLTALRTGEADTVIIAGMGGELVIHILEQGRPLWEETKRFILSPQSDLEAVRRYLGNSGFVTEQESMTEDEGKYYTVMAVRRKKAEENGKTGADEGELRYGRLLIEKKDPVLAAFLKKEEKRIESVLKKIEEQGKAGPELSENARSASIRLRKDLAIVRQTQKKIEANQRQEV